MPLYSKWEPQDVKKGVKTIFLEPQTTSEWLWNSNTKQWIEISRSSQHRKTVWAWDVKESFNINKNEKPLWSHFTSYDTGKIVVFLPSHRDNYNTLTKQYPTYDMPDGWTCTITNNNTDNTKIKINVKFTSNKIQTLGSPLGKTVEEYSIEYLQTTTLVWKEENKTWYEISRTNNTCIKK